MTLNSIGDLARGMTLRTRASQIRAQIETLSFEMSTGQVRNTAERLGGDYSQILDLDRSLTRLDAFKIATSEAALFTDAMQLSLTTFSDSVGEMSTSLLTFGTANHAVSQEQVSVKARNELDTMMSALNTRVGGRSLYSGTATDVSPLPSPDTLLTALQAELTGLTTIADIRQAAENWFNDPTGFESVIYQGADTKLTPMQISDHERIALPITATEPAFKAALRDVAVTVLAADDALAIPPNQRATLLKQLGVGLANAQDETVKLRAEVGAAEARIEEAATRNASTRTALEYSRNKLVAADPYQTAAKLQTVQFQLESLYSVTVRNANLSLVNFLR